MITKTERETLKAEYMKSNARKYADSLAADAAEIAALPGGELVPIDKRKIETRFCFGESGYDYDDAIRAAAHARTSADYFREENMKGFRDLIETLTQNVNETLPRQVLVFGKLYRADGDCRVRSFSFFRDWEVLESVGGSAYAEDLRGIEICNNGLMVKTATKEDAAAMLEAVKKAAADHEKKVNAYLKRYGTSKVNAWTYWRDA